MKNNTIFGGTYPNDPKEIFRVFPAYNKLSKKKKTDILKVLLSWTSGELNKIK